ncbi:hypothetical protein ES703_27231 [subsurface metagenome]
MAKLMTAKEYAKHVGTDPKTVRRWMRNGLLKFIPPPKEHPHYARLIDSSQPRPKKKEVKSANTDKPKVKSTANVTRQADKRSPNVASQPREKIADLPTTGDNDTVVSEKKTSSSRPAHQLAPTSDRLPRKPAFEKELQSPNIKPTANVTRQADKRPPKTASQPREKVADQDNGQSFVVLLAIAAFAKLVYDLVKKKQPQRESSHTKRANTYMLPNSLYAGYQPNQKIASLPKPTLSEILFGKQSKK